ncbi:aminotransferase class IV [Anaerostipes sp.]|uniref:aminotransferase class IV n=1 Tax=Anaerostipes sp. TaxID=1872530 RepID=UPI0025C22394|nr:aminotransferase class IV [Anaerostipes sp.]MBS7009225.1 aminotransferase class IV [Anaerostipes sp.]
MTVQADEGYYFGMGAFETVALEQGQPVLFEQHMNRLERTMQFLGIPFRRDRAERETEHYLKERNTEFTGHDALKIAVSEKNLTMSVRRNPYADRYGDAGFGIMYSEVIRNETSPLTYHKTLNYAENLMERRKAQERGFDEAVFLNGRGEIAEGTVSNVFFVKGNKLYTPPVSCGMLPGVMREYVCRTFKAAETVIRPEDVGAFDEMFLTNSLMGIMPVQNLGDHWFSSEAAAKQLQKTCCPGHFSTLP